MLINSHFAFSSFVFAFFSLTALLQLGVLGKKGNYKSNYPHAFCKEASESFCILRSLA